MTATLRLLYVFVAIEIGSCRIVHCNGTEHPTSEWTTQQFREFLAFDHPYRFVIHDRDAIFAPSVDRTLKGFGIHVLKTPARTPTANAFCERLVGTLRRECLDFMIPINERDPLQPRTPALRVRPWNSGTTPGQRSGQRPQAQAAYRTPSQIGIGPRRPASRI